MIKINNLSKSYGSLEAIKNISLTLEDNQIIGLFGPNGAGKTTLMKLIAGIISADKGEISVNNKKITNYNMPSNISFIESGAKQFNIKIKDIIKYSASFQENFDLNYANKMISLFKLNPDMKYKKLSFGMKTMLTTILNIASNNEVILLDEPVLGFDAIMREKFNKLLKNTIKQHKTIVISSHLISELENVVDSVVIINKGDLILYDKIENVQEKAYLVSGKTEDVEKAVEGKNILSLKKYSKFSNAIVYDKRITDMKVDISNVNLQDLFIELVGGNENE
jgi:ABC-2 type transport system ATP-binding protein